MNKVRLLVRSAQQNCVQLRMLSIFTLNTYQGYSHQHQVDSIEWHDAIQIIPLGMTISELFTVDGDKRLENTWSACGMRQDNSRFFEQLNLFGKNTLGNGFSVGC